MTKLTKITPAEKELAQLIIDGNFEGAQNLQDCGLELSSTVMNAIRKPVTYGLEVSDGEKAYFNAGKYMGQKMREGRSEEDLSSIRKQRASRLMLMEWAKNNGHKETIAFLNAKEDKPGMTAMEYAERNGHKELLALLKTIEGKPGMTAMEYAERNGHKELLVLLKTIEGNPEMTAMEWAKKNGHEDVEKYLVQQLIDAGADINVQEREERKSRKPASSKSPSP